MTVPLDRPLAAPVPLLPPDIAVAVEQLSKVYRVYEQPQDRLKEMMFSRFGRNGSGKSTLLQILAGTLAPSTGSVRPTGRVAALLELGSGFNPEYTGRENVYINASILGLTRPQIDEDAALPLDHALPVGEGARCLSVALTDEAGRACRIFEMGQSAIFWLAFQASQDLAVPVVGIELFNERNLNVHGKNSLQHDAPAPPAMRAGDVIRVRQRIALDVAPGQYTFGLGLATIDAAVYAQAAALSYPAIAEAFHATLIVTNAGAFAVVARRDGQALPHHGLCNLDGDVRLTVLDAEGSPRT
jgi:energy-coupling factor transporter ATP-binding protein EcfA2